MAFVILHDIGIGYCPHCVVLVALKRAPVAANAARDPNGFGWLTALLLRGFLSECRSGQKNQREDRQKAVLHVAPFLFETWIGLKPSASHAAKAASTCLR